MSVTTYLITSCQVLSICILHLVIMNNIEQWRIDSALWHFLKAGKGGDWGSSAFESQWHQWTVKGSLCALVVLTGGGPSAFESKWHQWTVKRSLCALAVLPGGLSAFGVHIFIYAQASICLWYLHVFFLYALVFPDIFLLFDCFKLALIGYIEKCRVHSACWQFWLRGSICLWVSMTPMNSEEIPLCSGSGHGGSICLWCLYLYICTGISYIVKFTWCHTDISLYLPISWLFWMGPHWLHWKAKSLLWSLAVSNGGSSTDTHTN